MKNLCYFLLILVLTFFAACTSTTALQMQKNLPHIVFVTGDEEYRSEESMPMLAKLLKKELDCTISICYSLDSLGYIDPNNTQHIAGLAALEKADMMVLFTRFRALPDEEAKYILDFAESGKPMVGFRTSTHAFNYPDDSTRLHLFEEWPVKVFGQKWITHHGHFEDGQGRLTDVQLLPNKSKHPILNGVQPFQAYSWLYHVTGGKHQLYGDSAPLLMGTSLRSKHQEAGRLDQFPLSNPVAWTKSYTGTSGKASRVFFTTLGHPYDFKELAMRKLALNGLFWALGIEEQIPKDGVQADLIGTYTPNNSGFGQKFKPKMRPVVLE